MFFRLVYKAFYMLRNIIHFTLQQILLRERERNRVRQRMCFVYWAKTLTFTAWILDHNCSNRVKEYNIKIEISTINCRSFARTRAFMLTVFGFLFIWLFWLSFRLILLKKFSDDRKFCCTFYVCVLSGGERQLNFNSPFRTWTWTNFCH